MTRTGGGGQGVVDWDRKREWWIIMDRSKIEGC